MFLVRSGNPKKIVDWNDLVRADVGVVTPNPRISGAGRWAFLAAWAYSLRRNPGDESEATRFVASIYSKNPVLDAGARGALLAFVDRKQGDVLLTWENEARHALGKHGEGEVAIIYPSMSILAEPAVAVMDRTAADRGTTEMAEAYLQHLFSRNGQEAAARHYLRPRDPEVAAKHADRFPGIELLTIDQVSGGWKEAEEKHFSTGGTFDRIYKFEHLKRYAF